MQWNLVKYILFIISSYPCQYPASSDKYLSVLTITLSAMAIFLPAATITLPAATITLPAMTITLPAVTITLPAVTITLPAVISILPAVTSTEHTFPHTVDQLSRCNDSSVKACSHYAKTIRIGNPQQTSQKKLRLTCSHWPQECTLKFTTIM